MLTKKEAEANARTLAELYQTRSEEETPAETVKRAADVLGAETLAETIAALVISNADDGRISRATLNKAHELGAPLADGEYMPNASTIHRAHLEQLAAYTFAHFDELKQHGQTAASVKEECKANAAELKKEEEAAAAALKAWQAVPMSDKLDTPPELRAIRKYEEHTKRAEELRKRGAVLRNNYRAKRFDELAPIVADILGKYAGKPYGEKTAEKIKGEAFDRARVYIYIDRARPCKMTIREARADGFTDPTGAKWEIYQRPAADFLADNRITAPTPSMWYCCGLKPYADNPAELVATLDELREKARKLAEELRAVCKEYSTHAPEGLDTLDASRI